MRLQQVAGIIAVSACTVAATDLLMQSSLLRIVKPRITSPADGAIVSAPVTVSWEGAQPMEATLTGNTQRIDLGLRESPFEIDASRFVRPGQYGIELRAPRFGSVIGAERRFMVRRPHERPAAPEESAADEPRSEPAAPTPPAPGEAMSAIEAERDQLRSDLAAWQAEVGKLRDENASLQQSMDELQAQSDSRFAAGEQERDALTRDQLQTLQENQMLRQRLDSIPSCTAWGYVSYPRPQTNPPSRLVVAGDRGGNVFRSETDCARARNVDLTGASPCVCVGPVIPGMP